MIEQIKKRSNKRKASAKPRGEVPLKKIISLRVSDLEREQLERISRRTRRSISDVLRDALEQWVRSQHPCMHG